MGGRSEGIRQGVVYYFLILFSVKLGCEKGSECLLSAYIEPLKIAIYIFPLLALFISFPFFMIQYRKFGRFLFLRGFILYSFVFYLLCAYFLIILPLPSIESVAQLTTPRYELALGKSLHEFLSETVFRPTQLQTYIPAMKQSVFLEPVFNILLFFPFGVYLRYYFGFSFKRVVLSSFLLSLFFELTQLSGLYFIYPRSYRLFDVNDLFHNTLGGVIGYGFAPLIMLPFPSKQQIDQRSVELGKEVTYIRRAFAVMIDWLLLGGVKQLLNVLARVFNWTAISLFIQTYWYDALIVFLYFMCITYMSKGQTLGKRFVKIKIVEKNYATIRLKTLIIRYGLLYWLYGGMSRLIVLLGNEVNNATQLLLISIILSVGVLVFCQFLFIFSITWAILKKDRQLFYEKKTNSFEISTVEVKEA